MYLNLHMDYGYFVDLGQILGSICSIFSSFMIKAGARIRLFPEGWFQLNGESYVCNPLEPWFQLDW